MQIVLGLLEMLQNLPATWEWYCEVSYRNTQIHKAMASGQWLAHVEHSDIAAAIGSDARCSGTTHGPLQPDYDETRDFK